MGLGSQAAGRHALAMTDRPADIDGPPPPDADFFGVDTPLAEARFQLIPVPWEATVSYRLGTADGPEAIRRASHQIDLLDPHFGDLSELGWCTTPLALDVRALSDAARARVEMDGQQAADRAFVDEQHAAVMVATRRAVDEAFDQGRVPVVLGGDHSVARAGIDAALARFGAADGGLGLLQIDAHADLRDAYEGYRSSHASIVRHVVEAHAGVKVFQLGIRDFCDEEREAIERFEVTTVFDRALADARLRGEVPALLERLTNALPRQVWLTVDIDGLDPSLCPNTGTPVPGGLLWDEMVLLLELLAQNRTLVGADLVEVSPGRLPPDGARAEEDTWDAIIGARLLYKMLGALAGRTRPALPSFR